MRLCGWLCRLLRWWFCRCLCCRLWFCRRLRLRLNLCFRLYLRLRLCQWLRLSLCFISCRLIIIHRIALCSLF
ncbi:hypothetical protein D7Y05_04610 [bacterium 1XD42-54]|nr:hypothetical protein D7Y05_04610 [bacterium 1XD42-54]